MPNNQDPCNITSGTPRLQCTPVYVRCRISSHAAGTPTSVILPGFLKTSQPTKHSGVMSIWLSAIFPTKAGSVAQVVPITDGLTSYAGTTTTRHQLTRGEDPPHMVIQKWHYGPRQLHVDNDDWIILLLGDTFSLWNPIGYRSDSSQTVHMITMLIIIIIIADEKDLQRSWTVSQTIL